MALVPFGTPDDPIYGFFSSPSGVKIQNSGGTVIDPATEQTLLAILAALGGTAGLKWFLYGESLGVASGVPTTVVTYTVPAGKKLILALAQGNCESRAAYEILVDGAVAAKKYTQVTVLSCDFSFGSGLLVGVEVPAGKVVKMVVTHSGGSVSDMNGTLFGELETI